LKPKTKKYLNGILYVLKTGVAWDDLFKGMVLFRWLDEWSQLGVWEAVWQILLASLDRAGKTKGGNGFP
jgi:transposase